MEKERKYYIEDIEQGLIEVTKEHYEEFHERMKQMFKVCKPILSNNIGQVIVIGTGGEDKPIVGRETFKLKFSKDWFGIEKDSMKKLSDKEMEAWAKEITSDSMFKERTQEDDELTTELQKQLDETYYYKNVTNPDGSYTQYLMKGDKCYGFHTYTKEEIEGIRKLEQKIEHEMWYGEYPKNKENMSADKEPEYNSITKDKLRQVINDASYSKENIWNEEYDKLEEEEWEKKTREELNAQLEDKLYEIGVPPHVAFTGKAGYIDYLITLDKTMKKELTESHSEIEIEKQRLWERHNKYEGAVRGHKKHRYKPTNITTPKKKRKK